MTWVLGASLVLGGWARHARFETATERPDVAQTAVLQALLRRNADTAFGREHGFARITGPAEYARRVPIRDFEGFRSLVHRILAGEARVLTAEAPTMFTTTSGTTGEPKLIPVTPSWQAEMAGLTRLWMLGAVRDHPDAFARDILTLVSPAVERRTPGGLPVGSLSGVAYQRLPWVVRRCHAVSYAVHLIRDPDARYFVTMRLALARSVSVVGTPNATTLIRLAETAAARSEELIRAVHDGTLGIEAPETAPEGGLTRADLLRAIRPRLGADPARARALARVAREHGALLPRYCWPDLRLIACWLGGSAGLHARRLADYYGEVPLRDLGLIASEGRMTVPLEDGSAAGALAVDTNFCEFIPEERIDDPTPPVRLAHELEDGRRYYILLSSGNGLYRYDINDVVEVQGFHRRTPRIAFLRKGRDMVSITGEKLHVNHLQAAIRESEDETKLAVWQFRFIPDVEGCRYDLLAEFRGGLADDRDGEAFVAAADRALWRLNREYASKRASKRLGAPRLHVMRPGWSERQCRADFETGKREVQYKWPAIRLEWDAASRTEVLRRLDAGGSADG